jgi:hypothetical protein
MEKVVAAVIGNFSTSASGGTKYLGAVAAVIDKNIRPGQFWATLENGDRVRVHSAAELTVGQKVTVLVPKPVNAAEVSPIPENRLLADKSGMVWTALLPFDFASGEGIVKLEVFAEKVKKHSLEKAGRASYLVFTTDFENGDTLQWSVYLKGKNLSLQIYSGEKTAQRHDMDKLSGEIEKRLKKLGFVLTVPTVRLVKPFKVPRGFSLNVRA